MWNPQIAYDDYGNSVLRSPSPPLLVDVSGTRAARRCLPTQSNRSGARVTCHPNSNKWSRWKTSVTVTLLSKYLCLVCSFLQIEALGPTKSLPKWLLWDFNLRAPKILSWVTRVARIARKACSARSAQPWQRHHTLFDVLFFEFDRLLYRFRVALQAKKRLQNCPLLGQDSWLGGAMWIM